jgi:hypothetical protein
MKTLLSLTLAVCISFTAFGQCNSFYPIKEDTKFQYEHFDKKDKLVLRTNQWFKDVTGSANNITATMVQEMIDVKKNSAIATSETEWTCNNGTLHFTMNNMTMEGQQANAASGMTVDITGDKMDLPPTLSVGQQLNDLTYNLKMMMSGMTLMNRTFDVTDRKVEARETVTTPAGTFDCYKVSFITTSKGGVGSGTYKTVIWYSKDAGMVKTENYSEKGALMGRQVLTKLER